MEHHVHKDLMVHVPQREVPHCSLEDEVILDLFTDIESCFIQEIVFPVEFAECSVSYKHIQGYDRLKSVSLFVVETLSQHMNLFKVFQSPPLGVDPADMHEPSPRGEPCSDAQAPQHR